MLYHKNAWLERLNTLMLQFKTDSQVIVGQAVTEYNQVGGLFRVTVPLLNKAFTCQINRSFPPNLSQPGVQPGLCTAIPLYSSYIYACM